MFETFESLPEPTTRKFAPGWNGKPKREIDTHWALGQSGQGTVRLYLTTHHDPDSKLFRSTLSWDVLEPAEPGSPFMVSHWGSDHHMVQVQRVSAPRYSQKALTKEHDGAIRWVEANWLGMGFYTVAQQAVEKSGVAA